MTSLKHIVEPKIGEGIYFARDVADILNLPYHKVKYSMSNFWQSYAFGERRNKAVNFYTMMEFYIYYHLREEKIKPTEIKKFHNFLSGEFDTIYPFASIQIKTHKKKIFYELNGFLLQGNRKKQPLIKEFIEPFLKKIEFGENLLAMRYFPLGENKKEVVVDPLHQFGQPVINGTNIQTATIYKLYKAGEKKRNICKLYDIKESDVSGAISYHLKRA